MSAHTKQGPSAFGRRWQVSPNGITLFLRHPKVQSCEPDRTIHAAQIRVDVWQRVAILIRDGVDSSVVNAQPVRAVFLFNENYIRCPWARGRFHDVIFYELFDLLVY